MQPGLPRLAIDYGTSATVAVLAWPDGRWVPLRFDDRVVLPSAVHVAGGGELVTGRQAWQQAAVDSQGFVAAPLSLGTGATAVAGADVEVEALVAATLRRVADEATRVVGEPVVDVRLVVPAGWGPRRRTWLRHAAYRAGLGQPRLVPAPVVAADLLLVMAVPVPMGAFLLLVDLGSGCEVTVLRRDPEGFEVLSTLADSDAGGSAIDELLLADAVRHRGTSRDVVADTGLLSSITVLDSAPGEGSRWEAIASVRAGKEAVSQHTAVTVALPAPAPAMVLNTTNVQNIARPVIQRVADLAADAVTAAELSPDDLFGVYCIGAASDTPGVPQIFGETLGVIPAVLPDPGLVAVVGVAGVRRLDTVSGHVPARVLPTPAARRMIALAVPGVASLVLVGQFLFTTTDATTGRVFTPGAVNWGELAMASVFAVLTCVAAGSLLGVLLTRLEQSRPDRKPLPVSPDAQIGTGVMAAAAIGVAAAGLYAVVTALYTGLSLSSPLRWALLPAVCVAVLAATVTLITTRRRQPPPHGWNGYLTFPPSAVILAGFGMFLVQHTLTAYRWPDLAGVLDLGTRLGGLLIGVGTAFILVKVWVLRLILAVPLGLFMGTVVTMQSIGVLAIMFTIAVLWWWAYRLLDSVRTRAQVPEHAD